MGPPLFCSKGAWPLGWSTLRECYLNRARCELLTASAMSILIQHEQNTTCDRYSILTHLERTEKQNNKPGSVNWTRTSSEVPRLREISLKPSIPENCMCVRAVLFCTVSADRLHLLFSTTASVTLRTERMPKLWGCVCWYCPC